MCSAVEVAWLAPVACGGLVMPGGRGDCLIGCPLPNSSVQQGRMVVIVTGYTLFVTLQYDVIFRFATNVLAKFVDTTCIFSDAEAAPGQGEQ